MAPALSKSDLLRFDAWFQLDTSLPDIARALNLPIVELAHWAALPHIKDRIAAVRKVAEERGELLHVEAKHRALVRLTRIVTESDNGESARKAATRILMTRLDDVPLKRRHGPSAHHTPTGLPSSNDATPAEALSEAPAAASPAPAALAERPPAPVTRPAQPRDRGDQDQPAETAPMPPTLMEPPAFPLETLLPISELPRLHRRAQPARPSAALFARAGAPPSRHDSS